MPSIRFEGKEVTFAEGDSVASALYRSGVRTFNRSLKYHRRRGLYCMTGDCPNCLVSVDGEPGVRSCTREAADGQVVRRETGWPGVDRDLLSITDHLHPFMPVGFYYKVFVRPRFAWEVAERLIRRATGVGALPLDRPPSIKPVRHISAEVLVIGAGPAGIAAAMSAGRAGSDVIVCDGSEPGWSLTSGPERERLTGTVRELAALPNVRVLAKHSAIGIYEGPLVPLCGPVETVHVRPERIVVATGALEMHPIFPGNDLPGVWLGRGAARLSAIHGVPVGSRAVVVATNAEGLAHLDALAAAGVEVAAVVVPEETSVTGGADVIAGGRIVGAIGRKHVEAARLATASGTERTVECDALVVSDGWAPRDSLLRMAGDFANVVGAGDVLSGGLSFDQAVASGEAAGRGEPARHTERTSIADRELPAGGFVCLCEDVGVGELEAAWAEGWRSSEILKRYTTATMGPCQGALCGLHLAAFVEARGAPAAQSSRTTSRPPARPVRLEDLAAGVDEVIQKRTALHDVHRKAGASLGWSGSWIRPYRYGDVQAEYAAVRSGVSLMDVSTLGKFLIAGRDATELVDRVIPCNVKDLVAGRSRYFLALDEAGYVMDDGLISALEDRRWYLTSTSGGADRMEAWLRDWSDRWALDARVVNQTSMTGAINVAGPRARELLQAVTDDDVSAATISYPGHARISIGGIGCRAIRVGFVGELSFELHHARSRSAELWEMLKAAGEPMGVLPHGLDALDLLRLEKGHLYLGQDTLPDDHPVKLGLGWALATGKPYIGRTALDRMSQLPLGRKLVGLRFGSPPQRGMPLSVDGLVVGRVTSCARSDVLESWIGLGWIRAIDGAFPDVMTSREVQATVAPTPFYDPTGERMRA